MALTPKQLQERLDQLNDYIEQLGQVVYSDDKDSFKRYCLDPIDIFLKTNKEFEIIPEMRDAFEKVRKLAQEALLINAIESDRRLEAAGKKVVNKAKGKPVSRIDLLLMINEAKEKVNQVDIDKSLAILNAPSQPASLQATAHSKPESTIEQVAKATSSVPTKSASASDFERRNDQAAALKHKEGVKRKAKNVNNKLAEEAKHKEKVKRFKNIMKEYKSDVKNYKGFVKADNKGKSLYKDQDVRFRDFFVNKFREGVDLSKMLDSLEISEKERKKYDKAVSSLKRDIAGVLAYDKVEEFYKNKVISHYIDYDRFDAQKFSNFSSHIDSLQHFVNLCLAFKDNYQKAKNIHPELFTKKHVSLLREVDVKLNKIGSIIDKFKLYEKGKDLNLKIDSFLQGVQDGALLSSFGISSDKYMDAYRGRVLSRLNDIKNIFKGDYKKEDVARSEKEFKEITEQYQQAVDFYNKALVVHIKHDQLKADMEERASYVASMLPTPLQEFYLNVMKNYWVKNLAEMVNRDQFKDPSADVDFSRIGLELESLNNDFLVFNDFFMRFIAIKSLQEKQAEGIGLKLTGIAFNPVLAGAYQKLENDISKAFQSIASGMVQPFYGEINTFFELLAQPNYTENYSQAIRLESVKLGLFADQAVLAFEKAEDALKKLEEYQQLLSGLSGDYAAVKKEQNAHLEEATQSISSLLEERPLDNVYLKVEDTLKRYTDTYSEQCRALLWVDKEASRRMDDLHLIINNELNMLNQELAMLKDSSTNQDKKINDIKQQIGYLKNQQGRLEILKGRDLQSGDDAVKLKADVERMEDAISSQVFRNALSRVWMMNGKRSNHLDRYDLMRLENYLNLEKDNLLGSAYSRLFELSKDDFVKNHQERFINLFKGLVARVKKDKLLDDQPAPKKSLVQDEKWLGRGISGVGFFAPNAEAVKKEIDKLQAEEEDKKDVKPNVPFHKP